VYAPGLVLYELFTGRKGFDASSLAELHRKQNGNQFNATIEHRQEF
jgi:hypothetical protein